MRLFTLFAIAISIALLAGCAPAQTKADYQTYIEFVQRQQVAEEARIATIAGTAAGCATDECRTHIAALAALSAASHGGKPLPAPPRQEPSTAGKVALALVGQLGPLASAAVSWHQSDNATRSAEAQYQFLGGVVQSVVSSPALQSPTITVGGDYVSGEQHIGDAVGGDLISGHIGDAVGGDLVSGQIGDTVGGDQVGGDQIGGDAVDGDGNYNAGRWQSPDEIQPLPAEDGAEGG